MADDGGSAWLRPSRRASSLFKSKLRAPARPDHYVRRVRLIALMDDAVRAPLTVVVAPAGAGKTSLLAGWADESALPTAWLSLDESDRDGAQLWTGLVAAIETLSPGCGEHATPLLRRPDTLAEGVRRLLDDLDAGPADRPPAVLVVDDLHLVHDDRLTAETLALFVQHLPSWLRLVLISRRDPPLPMDRLRARGRLREVRFAELRFVPDEAERMLSKLAPAMPGDQVAATSRHARGWAAGLHLGALAARAAQARPDTAPALDADLMIEDYVLREVLGAESPAVTAALTDIAVVERVDPRLAEALTERPDAAELLLQAEERGLFVTRIDAGWFEMHALVREVLVAQLARRSPERLATRHARAARWFADADEVPLALEHWLRAGLPREALRLLAVKNLELYDTGLEATIVRTLAAIPPGVATADLSAMIDYAWCHLLVSRRGFLDAVDRLSWWAAQPAHRGAGTAARITMLRSIAATMTGDWSTGRTLARRTLTDAGASWWRDPVGRVGWNMLARALALYEQWDDASDDVRGADLAVAGDPERQLALEGTRALGEALAGRPIHAVEVVSGVRRSATMANRTVLRAELATAEALAHRELGDRPRALAASAEIVATALEPVLYCRVLAQLDLAEAHTDDGDLAAAHDAFDQARALAEPDLAGPGGRTLLARVAARLQLADGETERARRWSDQIVDPFWRAACTARILLAEGHHSAAAESLEQARPRCVRHDVVRNLLLSRAAGSHEAAIKYAAAAAERAAANGMVQTVASEGGEIIELIERAAWQVPPEWLDRVRRTAVPHHGEAQQIRGTGEPLTQRERDVLRFLPSRLSLPEIADELYISVNTLKFHVKVIYRKLGVRSRAEAAEAARAMAGLRR
ncbi:helix-turn-helix transcriptional regulator [Jiangella endophytica]|uniref:helix-turn-helix transcriptional regulator n=1 Tax=Jiangella endophytica TaxID=1623398 RepID=UPI000E35082C|nr:LuxR C-terminal-related transcriptional regulator [Jiangella endophytica]